jgi:bifunctional DNase/RNase
MVEVRLSAVRVDLYSSTPVVLLEETEGARRSLAIFIGAPEATAIALALQGVELPRPMTHDLLVNVLGEFDARIERVVVTELVEATYFAELRIRSGDREIAVSCRPSDGIALALRARASLYVSDDLMDAEGRVMVAEEDDEANDNPDELVGEFREFLDTITPEDFGG